MKDIYMFVFQDASISYSRVKLDEDMLKQFSRGEIFEIVNITKQEFYNGEEFESISAMV